LGEWGFEGGRGAETETCEIVSFEATGLDPGVTEAGEKEQLKFLGRPRQESAIGALKAPDWGLALTITLTDCPAGKVKETGVALR
jgi:hypothetical protein